MLRGLDVYRRSFVASGREGASPWTKEKGRWRLDEARFRRVHTFVDIQGQVRHVAFGGRELIAMQDYRSAWSPDDGLGSRGGSQAELDAWLKAHPSGVVGDDGETYFPETDLKAIHARIKRMPARERKSFAADVRYVVGGGVMLAECRTCGELHPSALMARGDAFRVRQLRRQRARSPVQTLSPLRPHGSL